MKHHLLLSTIALGAMTACSGLTPEKIAGEWTATTITSPDGNIITVAEDDDNAPYLGFEQNRVYGYNGCNRVAGTIDYTARHFTPSQMAGTLMACLDTKYEKPFMDALNHTSDIKVRGKHLTFINAEKQPVLTLTRREITAELVTGTWDVVEMNGKSITPAENTPFLTFDPQKQHIAGFTGCNRLTGPLNVKDLLNGKIDFSQTGTTRMLCVKDIYESDFLKTIAEARYIKREKGKLLIIVSADGKRLLTLRKR